MRKKVLKCTMFVVVVVVVVVFFLLFFSFANFALWTLIDSWPDDTFFVVSRTV